MSAVAVVVYGLVYRESFVKQALDDLPAVLEINLQRQLIIANSLAQLCANGFGGLVLDALSGWADDQENPDRANRSLAVFLRLTRWTVVTPQPQPQPLLLLQLADENEVHRERVVGLWRRVWNHCDHENLREALKGWLSNVQERGAGHETLDALMDDLAQNGAQHQLLEWLVQWEEDPEGPQELARIYREWLAGRHVTAPLIVRAWRVLVRGTRSLSARMRQRLGPR